MILAVTLEVDTEENGWENFDQNATRKDLADAMLRCFELIEEFRDENRK